MTPDYLEDALEHLREGDEQRALSLLRDLIGLDGVPAPAPPFRPMEIQAEQVPGMRSFLIRLPSQVQVPCSGRYSVWIVRTEP